MSSFYNNQDSYHRVSLARSNSIYSRNRCAFSSTRHAYHRFSQYTWENLLWYGDHDSCSSQLKSYNSEQWVTKCQCCKFWGCQYTTGSCYGIVNPHHGGNVIIWWLVILNEAILLYPSIFVLSSFSSAKLGLLFLCTSFLWYLKLYCWNGLFQSMPLDGCKSCPFHWHYNTLHAV